MLSMFNRMAKKVYDRYNPEPKDEAIVPVWTSENSQRAGMGADEVVCCHCFLKYILLIYTKKTDGAHSQDDVFKNFLLNTKACVLVIAVLLVLAAMILYNIGRPKYVGILILPAFIILVAIFCPLYNIFRALETRTSPQLWVPFLLNAQVGAPQPSANANGEFENSAAQVGAPQPSANANGEFENSAAQVGAPQPSANANGEFENSAAQVGASQPSSPV